MASAVEALLREIQGKLLLTMPEEELAAVLLEVESHLRERMTDHQLEGVSPESAEILAVREFGPIAPFATEIADAHEHSAIGPRAVIAATALNGLFFFIANIALYFAPNWPGPVLLALYFGGNVLGAAYIGAASWRCRKVVPVPLIGVSFVWGLAHWLTYGSLLLDLRSFGGLGLGYRVASWNGTQFFDPEAYRRAIEAPVYVHFLATKDIFIYTWLILAAVAMTANLIGVGLGRLSRRRRTTRKGGQYV